METIAALALAAFLLLTGVAHWIKPGYFRTLIPRRLPAPGWIVTVSGALEVLIAVAIAVETTRQAGAWAAAILITGYLPAHLDPLFHGPARRLLDRPVVIAIRLLINAAYIAWALGVALSAE